MKLEEEVKFEKEWLEEMYQEFKSQAGEGYDRGMFVAEFKEDIYWRYLEEHKND